MRKSIPLFQDLTRDHPSRGDDVCPFSRCRYARWRTCSTNAGSTSAMKPSELGGIVSDRYLQRRSDSGVVNGIGHFPAGAGISTKFSSGSMAKPITSGERLTMRARFWRRTLRRIGDRKAALRFLRKTMKRYGRPEAIVTDRLRSYRAAMKVIGNAERQETGRWLNNRAENSHQPFRRRERAMAKFRSAKSLQKFCLNPFFSPKSLQQGTPSLQPRNLQTQPLHRGCRVASTGCLRNLDAEAISCLPGFL